MRGLGSIGRFVVIAAFGAVLVCPSLAVAYTPEEEQACSGDALRLCSAEVPNVDRITACMEQKKAQLSPACRAFFGPDEDARVAGKPLDLKPASGGTSMSAKSRQAKKPVKQNSAE